jgi:hypothetical protein
MQFKIVGANSETGDDVDVILEAASQSEVERIAHERHILVSAVSAIPVAAHAPAHASQAPAAGHKSSGGTPAPAHGPSAHATAHGTAVHAPAANPSHGSQAPGAHPPKEKDFSSIALIDDEPPAEGTDPNTPKHERAHGIITVNANNPGETARSGAGSIDQGKHSETPMEYHVILNQSLFLLESAVNKHLREGWEPSGGLAVGVINNAPQYFQALKRKRKPGSVDPTPAAPSAPAAPANSPPAASN